MIHQIIRKATRLLEKKSRQATRDHFYFHKVYFKRTSFLYDLFLKKKDAGEIFITEETIQPLGIKFGADYKEVIKTIGKASFSYNNKSELHNHKAVFVRQTINNLNLLIQLQFFNNSLFFISLDLSRNIKNEEEKIEIINTLIEKYLNKPFKEGDEYPIIEDSKGSFIIINDDVNFSICYYGNNLKTIYPDPLGLIEKSATLPDKKDKESLFYAF